MTEYPRFNRNPKPPLTRHDGWWKYLRYLWQTSSQHSAFEHGYAARDDGPVEQH